MKQWLKDNWKDLWVYIVATLITAAFLTLAIISGFATNIQNLPGVIAGSLGVFLMVILFFKQIKRGK